MEVLVGVLTVSDRVHQKQAEDLSGPKILEIFKSRKDDFKVMVINAYFILIFEVSSKVFD